MKLFEFLFAAALTFPANDVSVSQPEITTQPSNANHCVEIRVDRIYNSCDYMINISWCIEGGSNEGYTCNGEYRGTWNIVAYGTYPHFGEDSEGIKYVACRGQNTLRTEGYDAWCT